jgi:hypothetical protein
LTEFSSTQFLPPNRTQFLICIQILIPRFNSERILRFKIFFWGSLNFPFTLIFKIKILTKIQTPLLYNSNPECLLSFGYDNSDTECIL